MGEAKRRQQAHNERLDYDWWCPKCTTVYGPWTIDANKTMCKCGMVLVPRPCGPQPEGVAEWTSEWDSGTVTRTPSKGFNPDIWFDVWCDSKSGAADCGWAECRGCGVCLESGCAHRKDCPFR